MRESQQSFRDIVLEYVELHDQLALLNASVRELRAQKMSLGEGLLTYMKAHHVTEAPVCEGRLVLRTSKRTESLKENHFVAAMVAYMSLRSALDLFQRIQASRTIKYTDALSRLTTRK